MTHRITSQKSTFKGVCFLPNGHDGECCYIVSQRPTYVSKKVTDLPKSHPELHNRCECGHPYGEHIFFKKPRPDGLCCLKCACKAYREVVDK